MNSPKAQQFSLSVRHKIRAYYCNWRLLRWSTISLSNSNDDISSTTNLNLWVLVIHGSSYQQNTIKIALKNTIHQVPCWWVEESIILESIGSALWNISISTSIIESFLSSPHHLISPYRACKLSSQTHWKCWSPLSSEPSKSCVSRLN